MTYHRVFDQINTTDATSGAGTAYHSGIPEFTPRFSGINATRSLALCICFVDRGLSFFLPLCCLSACNIQGNDIIYLENREIKGPDQLFSFPLRISCIDVHSMQMNEEICIERSTVGTLRSVDCLLKHTFIKHSKSLSIKHSNILM